MEPGWENTLIGLPKEMYSFWDRHLLRSDTRSAFRSSTSRRRAGRHRSYAEMGLNKSAIEQSCSAAFGALLRCERSEPGLCNGPSNIIRHFCI